MRVHGSATCDININHVLAQCNMEAKPDVAKTIAATNAKYIRRSSPCKPNNNLHLKQKGRWSAMDVPSGERKKGLGKVQKVTWNDEEGDKDDENSVQSASDEGVASLCIDDDSDPEEKFVLSVETCVPYVDGCDGIDKLNLHLNY